MRETIVPADLFNPVVPEQSPIYGNGTNQTKAPPETSGPVAAGGSPDFNFVPVAVRRSFIWSYRIAAILTLYGVLAGVFGYVFLMIFYAVDSSWVAPVIISPSDLKSLDLRFKIRQAEGTAQSLRLDVEKLQASLAEYGQHLAALRVQQPQVEAAIVREGGHDSRTARDLERLNQRLGNENLEMEAEIGHINDVKRGIKRDLQLHLISNEDALPALAALDQAEIALTNSQVAELSNQDMVLLKTPPNTTQLEKLFKQTELISEASELQVAVEVAKRQINIEVQEIEMMYGDVEIARQNPYYLPITRGSKVTFAFVPYANRSSVHIGSPVYDCYLNMAICRKVGTVKASFPEEEHAIHPLFRTDMRGFLIQIEFTDPGSAESEALMLNHKPLLF